MIKRCFEVGNEVIMVLIMIFCVGFFYNKLKRRCLRSKNYVFNKKNKSSVKIENNA